MRLHWIDQGKLSFVAIEGAYRLRILPQGLIFQVSLFEGKSAAGAKDWSLLGRRQATSVYHAKRLGEDLLAEHVLTANCAGPQAAQGGI